MQEMTAQEFEALYGFPPPKPKPSQYENQETKATRGFATGLVTGFAKGAGELVLGLGQMGNKFAQETVGRGIEAVTGVDRKTLGPTIFQDEGAQQVRDTALKANEPGEGTGKFISVFAQYMLPTGRIVQGQKVLSSLAQQVPTKVGRFSAKVGARFAPEAMGTGMVGLTRSGGDVEQGVKEGVLAGGFSVGLKGLAGLARTTYWTPLKESVTKGLGFSGKMSGRQALQTPEKKIEGLSVLKRYAPETTVVEDGVEVAFNPLKATYNTTLQAWEQTSKKIFEQYDTLARKAGGQTAVDISDLTKGLRETLDQPGLGVYKTAVNSLIKDIESSFPDPTKVDIMQAQNLLKQINGLIGDSFYKGTSDKAFSEVYAGFAIGLRNQLDDVITSAQGAGYKELRAAYGALKNIEQDLVRMYQQQQRGVGGGLPEYLGIVGAGDIVSSIARGDVVGATRGGIMGALGAAKRTLSSRERFLQRSFKLLDKPESNKLIQRLFGTTAVSSSVVDDIGSAVKRNPHTKPIDLSKPSGSTGKKINTQGGFINPKAIADDFSSGAKTPLKTMSASEAKKAGMSFDDWVKGQTFKTQDTYISKGMSGEDLNYLKTGVAVPGVRTDSVLNTAKDNVRNFFETLPIDVDASVLKNTTNNEKNAISHIYKAWEANNLAPHGYASNSPIRTILMDEKSHYIKKATKLIDDIQSEKIKTWHENGVRYFEVNKRQISFHETTPLEINKSFEKYKYSGLSEKEFKEGVVKRIEGYKGFHTKDGMFTYLGQSPSDPVYFNDPSTIANIRTNINGKPLTKQQKRDLLIYKNSLERDFNSFYSSQNNPKWIGAKTTKNPLKMRSNEYFDFLEKKENYKGINMSEKTRSQLKAEWDSVK